MGPEVQRPTPQPDADTAEFWAATLKGRLRIQQCRSCGRFVHYPRAACPSCMSRDLGFEDASGRGVVYSYTIVYRAPAAFADEVPYVVALVDLDEGARLLSRLVGVTPDSVAIGMPVQVTFHPLSDDAALPFFEPRP